jgi:hypothetical protein
LHTNWWLTYSIDEAAVSIMKYLQRRFRKFVIIILIFISIKNKKNG